MKDSQKKVLIDRPEEEETLAKKKEEKTQKLRRLPAFSPQGWVGRGEALGLAVVFFVNFWLFSPFFGAQDQNNLFSAPLLPFLINLTNSFIPYWFGVRIWLISFMIFLPISLYYFVREVSGRRLAGFLASLMISLPMGFFLADRIDFGLLGEDGAYMASLTLIPLICLSFLKFLRRGSYGGAIVSAVGTTLVALTSPFGLLTLFVCVGVLTFSEMLLGKGRLKLMRFLVLVVLSAGFSAFWYNPKFILLMLGSPQGQLVKGAFFNLLPISLFLIPLLGVFGFLLFENRVRLQSVFIAFFLTVAFLLLYFGTGFEHPSPSRFLPALGISLASLIGILVTKLFDFLRFSSYLDRFKLPKKAKISGAFSILAIIFLFSILKISISGHNIGLEDFQVLGDFTDGARAGLWEIRGQISSTQNFIGYAISGITSLSVVILKFKLSV